MYTCMGGFHRRSDHAGQEIKYDIIGLTGTRRHRTDRDRPLNAFLDPGGKLCRGTCDNRGVGGVEVLVNTNLIMNIDSFEQLTTRIGRLRLRTCGCGTFESTPALTIFIAYARTSRIAIHISKHCKTNKSKSLYHTA
ncbi:hypothetical protein ANCDUO_01270 [Ancylostoma duodenale]|uniref:Uncharacterized protein n=1 Tax=Ancylostoma duodenale TaxID=51022 RepID=A0A0C2H3K2_9BILA|nr:hypothetical protein ANCDUO_01270 [Ancylostoma duodenale]